MYVYAWGQSAAIGIGKAAHNIYNYIYMDVLNEFRSLKWFF